MTSLTPSVVEPSAAAGTSPQADRVVRELDVYVANGVLGAGTQMYLLQSPLRPPWRSYQEEGLEKVRLKPKVKKLQCEARLDTGSRNYNSNVENSRQIKTIALQSSRVDMRAQLAGAYIEQDALILFPIDEAMQLRPNMAYLDKEKEAANGGKKGQEGLAEDEKVTPELMPLQVQVKRRETEHQQQARLRSYAYLQQQEEQDAWVDLRYHGEDSDVSRTAAPLVRLLVCVNGGRRWEVKVAGKLWEQLARVAEEPQDLNVTMTRQQYLDAIVPGKRVTQRLYRGNASNEAVALPGIYCAASLEQPPQEMDFGGNVGLIDLGQPSSYASRKAMEEAARARGRALAGVAAAAAAAGAAGGGAGAPAGRGDLEEEGWGRAGVSWAEAAAASLPAEVVAALPLVLAQVLKYSPVLSLDQIRRFIQNLTDSPVKPAGAAPDAALHAAVLAGGTVVCIRKCYMHKKLGNPTLDPLRDVVLELLGEKEAIRRSDVVEAAKAKGIQVSDALYSKVVKELCISRGSLWSLKSPS
ncbi:hypothetical protein N2152v2_001316 [Parachlorella kessleri]